MNIAIVHTPRLTLRGFTSDDLEPLQAILSDRDVLRYFPRTEPWTLEMVEEWVDRHYTHWSDHGFGWFALEHREKNELIGWCGLGVLDDTQEVEVLYLLTKPFWGNGLATEAAKWCVEDAFCNLDLDLVIGLTHPENIASRRVLEKIGMSFTNKARYFDMDCFRYTIDRDQFEAFHRVERPTESA